jgi:hypothetical protein
MLNNPYKALREAPSTFAISGGGLGAIMENFV